MEVIPDFRSVTLNGFVQHNVAPGSTIYTGTGSKASPDLNKPDSGIFRAPNHCKATFARARNQLRHWRTEPSAIYNNGSSEPITA